MILYFYREDVGLVLKLYALHLVPWATLKLFLQF